MDSDVLVRSAMLFEDGTGGRPGEPVALPGPKDTLPCPEGGPGISVLLADTGARMIADADHRVVWSTSGAALLASGRSCISIANGALGGRTRHSDALLREILDEARLAAPRAVDQLIAPEPSLRPELFVRAQSYPGRGAPFTLLTFRNLAGELQGIPDLGHLYGLTGTEQRIVAMMFQGQSVTEIAQSVHKSVLTIRTHVKRIYGKLNVGTKEQLFSTVLKLMVD
jgi:DNA-binding CsgD family transcriptional regulator